MARFQYVNDTVQELYVQTYQLQSTAIKELKTLRQLSNPEVNDGGSGWSATATSLAFDSLEGTIPPAGVFLCGDEKIQYGSITWISPTEGTFENCKRGWENTTPAYHANNTQIYFGDAFAQIVTLVSDSTTTIPFVNLDRPGQIPETGVVFIESEWIFYGGVTYTNNTKTAGNLLYCLRGYNGTSAAAHNGSTTPIIVRFEHNFKHREFVSLYNYIDSNATLYYGFNPTITNTGTNAFDVGYGESETLKLGSNVRIFGIHNASNVSGIVTIAEWR